MKIDKLSSKLKIIKDAIKICIQDQKNINSENQKGGGKYNSNILFDMIIKFNKINDKLEEKIREIDNLLKL